MSPGPIGSPSERNPLQGLEGLEPAAEATQAGEAGAPADAAQAGGPVTRPGSGLEELAGSLLRRVLDQAAPRAGAPPATLRDQLELAFSGMRLLAACQKDPQAAQDFLKNATFDQRQLLSGLKSFASELQTSPDKAILGGLGTLSKALDAGSLTKALGGREGVQSALGQAERALAGLPPLHQGSKTVSGGTATHGSKSGTYDGALGKGGYEAAGKAGASGTASGQTRVGADGATAAGQARGLAGAEGAAQGEIRNAFGTATGQASGRAGAAGDAKGTAHVGPAGARASGEAHGFAGAEGSARGKIDTALGSLEGGVRGSAGAKADAAGKATADLTGVRAEGKARAEVGGEVEADAHLKTAIASANAKVRAEALAYGEVSGKGKADLTGASVNVKGEVGARAQVSADADFRTAGVQIGGERVDLNGEVHAQAMIEARASAQADVAATINPPRAICDVGASAFVGAKAGVQGRIGVGDFVSLTGHAEAWAGAGAEAGLVCGFDEGKLRFGFNLGAAVGVGYGGGFGVEIDVASIANAAIGGGLNMAESAMEIMMDPTNAMNVIARDLGELFVGPDEQPQDYGLYPQLAQLFPPMVYGQGTSRADADKASKQTMETIQRLAHERAEANRTERTIDL